MEIFFCEACGTRLSDAELPTGEAVRDGDNVYCRPCALKLGIYERVREESRREARPRDRTPVRRPRPRSSRAAPAAPGSQTLVYVACGIGAVVVTALVVVIAKKSGRKRPAERPLRTVVRPTVSRSAPVRPPVSETPPPPEVRPPVPVPPPPVRPPVLARPPAPSPADAPPRPDVPPPPPEPLPEGWTSIFNGRDLKGWRKSGGRAWVEDGALVSANNTDLFYKADWTEFVLSCEIKAGGGETDFALGMGLGQTGMGRGQWRVGAAFHTDGDLHIRVKRVRLWKSGGGKFPLDRWTRVKLEMTRTALRIYRGDELLGSVGLNTVPVQKGGIYFFADNGHTARLRNARVRVISR